MLIIGIVTIIAYIVLYGIINAPIPGVFKAFLGIGEMVLAGLFIARRLKIRTDWGLMMLRSQRGLDVIERIAKSLPKVANYLADCNVVLAYGLLSVVLMRKHVRPSTLFGGLSALAILIFVVAPFIPSVLQSVIGVEAVGTAPAEEGVTIPYLFYIYIALLLGGGLFIILLLGIWVYGALVLSALVSTLIYGTQAIQNTQPGGTFLLPGINLPLFEGIAALAIILIVHEGAHAILARVGRIKVKSSGLVLFGVIPIGAFVEPDEEALTKAPSVPQSRVIMAGTAANFLTCILLFVLWFGMFAGLQGFRDTGMLVLPAQGSSLEQGTLIYSINGQKVTNFDELAEVKETINPKQDVTLETNKGTKELTTDEEGRIGVLLAPVGKQSIIAVYTLPLLGNIYTLLGLAFVLNFVIGTINLLPLPFFDGYRMLDINMKNKAILKGLMYLTLVAFVMNFVPWLFR